MYVWIWPHVITDGGSFVMFMWCMWGFDLMCELVSMWCMWTSTAVVVNVNMAVMYVETKMFLVVLHVVMLFAYILYMGNSGLPPVVATHHHPTIGSFIGSMNSTTGITKSHWRNETAVACAPHAITCSSDHTKWPAAPSTQESLVHKPTTWTLQHVQPKPPRDATCASNLLNAPQPFAWRYNPVVLLACLHPLACYLVGFKFFYHRQEHTPHPFGYIPILRVSTSHFHGSPRHDF
jgi:hypothetical protein